MKKIMLALCSFHDEQVATDWKEICRENTELSYFGSYEFNQDFVKSFKKNRRRKNMKLLLVRVYEASGKTLMFLPLCKKKNEYYFMWDYSSVMYCGPICRAGLTPEIFDEVINKLPELIGNEVIFFTKMNDMSPFTKYLRKRYTPYKKRSCIKIELPETFDAYCEMMTDEGWETVQEGRDILADIGVSFRTYFYYNKPLAPKLFEKLYTMYYGTSDSFVDRMKDRIYDNGNAVSCALKRGERSLLAVACVNGEPVGFVGGFVSGDCLTVVRQGQSKRYEDCNVISILYSDLMKYCIERKNIKTVDFGKGHEEFKFDLGGELHYRYYFEIKL